MKNNGSITKQVKNLPWKMIREIGFSLRVAVATKPVPDQDHILAKASIEELERIHRNNHYREGWFISYNYHGEDANLCRAEYKESGGYTDYQHHNRLFSVNGKTTRIHSHFELDPIIHPRKHLNGVNHNINEGIDMTTSMLDRYNIEYEVVRV